jgi:hypothetical protein
MPTVDPYGVEAIQVTADSLAVTGRFYLRQVCVVHTAGTDVEINIYDQLTAPSGGDVPHCKIPALGKGVNTIPVPAPGLMFMTGAYVDLPNNTSIVLFIERA